MTEVNYHPTGSKWCSRCFRDLPTSQFSHSISNRDGLRHICKTCDVPNERHH